MSTEASEGPQPGVWVDRERHATRPSPWAQAGNRLSERLRRSQSFRDWVTRQFHLLYYGDERRTWRNTYWRGIGVAKCPTDLWMYQELVNRLRPELIVETGTFEGGSARFFADLLDLNGEGHVVTVDLAGDYERPRHDRITYLAGSSVDPAVLSEVAARADGCERVMVVLDSDHTEEHVREELRSYAPFVTPGSYLVVEDSNVNGHPVAPEFGPGPMEAVDAFLAEHPEFARDRDCEKFLLSFNPGGWLRRSS